MNAREEYEKFTLPTMICGRAIGSWPNRAEVEGQRNFRVLCHRFHRFLVIAIMFVLSGAVVIEGIVYFGEDMGETIESALVSSALIMTFARVATFACHQPDMYYILETMREDWISATVEERAILKKKCLLAFKVTKFFLISVLFCGSAFAVIPLLELKFTEGGKRVLPYRGYFFFNHTVPGIYEYMYAASAMGGAIGCLIIAFGTNFFVIATIHAATKFSIIKREFLKIDSFSWSNNKIVGMHVHRHRQCLRFAEAVENTINFLALIQFATSTVIICLGGFQLTTMKENSVHLTKYSSFLNAAVSELFMFTFSGQSLKDQSEEVAEFVYNSDWLDRILNSNMRIIIERARKPCLITAGKFCDMTLETFLKVMNSSFSYFTVLLAMREE